MKNFGDLLDAIYSTASKQFATNRVRCGKVIKECVRTIKTDNILSDQFTIYDNLKNAVISEKQITDYINENINSLRKYKTQQIIESNNKLEKLCNSLGVKVKTNKINESISNLYFLMNTAKNINSLHESRNIIKENLLTNEKKEVTYVPSVPIALVSKIVSKKYNKKYKDLTESDKKILKTILENKEGNQVLFEKYKSTTVDLLSKSIVENDDATLHTNLKKTYNKVTSMKFTEGSAVNDISRLHYLIDGLQ
jgi:hypothetical protein|tara:strand:- start:404 stop:1159 length:756 start_codon:yes stop_codon:yes gene_type:complete